VGRARIMLRPFLEGQGESQTMPGVKGKKAAAAETPTKHPKWSVYAYTPERVPKPNPRGVFVSESIGSGAMALQPEGLETAAPEAQTSSNEEG